MKATRFSSITRFGLLPLLAALTFETAAVAQTKSTDTSIKATKSAKDPGRTKRPNEVARRGANKSVLPPYSNVTIYTAQDIERSGAGTLDQFLHKTTAGSRR
jgi:hypothetical protein